MPKPEHTAEFVLLQLALPAQPVRNVGALLLDRTAGRLHWQLRSDWSSIAPPEEAEVLSLLVHDFASNVQRIGAEQFLLSLEDQLSNVLRLSERRSVDSQDHQAALRELFRQHCMDDV